MSSSTSHALPTSAAITAPDAVRAQLASACVFAMGLAIVFVVGFAQPQILHDAAHDTRHTLAFPCH